MAAFDWYQATVKAPLDDVISAMLAQADGIKLRHARAPNRTYAHSAVFSLEDMPMGECWHGGIHEHPHVQFTGDAAIGGARMLREHFPGHAVARVDVREDFGGADTFDRIQARMLAAAERHRVKVDTAGDHLLRKVGRTIYLGARQSAVRLRQYDKAAELRHKFAKSPDRLAQVPEHLTRLEVQVRPDGAAKVLVSQSEPAEFFGASTFSRDVWADVTGMDVPRINVGKSWRQSDDDRAYDHLLSQYGGLLLRRIAEHGSGAAFGRQLEDDLAARAEALAKLKGVSRG